VKAKKIERELVQILEEENVSSDVGDLIPFERDDQFALVPPHRPDIVVRPSTREEVQEILKLANRHKVPVVPLASGINRKGLCIASKGGILWI
jgi:FAD/FMN-containing dehydrogenases